MKSGSAEHSPSALTRRRLVRATQDAIRELGLPGATAREITGRAGANLAAIPYHFGSKDALVTEALIADAHTIVDPVLELLASDRPPVDRALEAAALLNQRFDSERDRVPALLTAIARAPHSPEAANGLAALWAAVRIRVAEDLRALVDTGHVPAWVEPDAMAALILAVVSGVVVASVADPDGPSHDAVGAQFLGLLMAVAAGGAVQS